MVLILILAFEEWQKQFDRMLEDKAKELIAEKIDELDDLLNDFRDSITSEIKKRYGIESEDDY